MVLTLVASQRHRSVTKIRRNHQLGCNWHWCLVFWANIYEYRSIFLLTAEFRNSRFHHLTLAPAWRGVGPVGVGVEIVEGGHPWEIMWGRASIAIAISLLRIS